MPALPRYCPSSTHQRGLRMYGIRLVNTGDNGATAPQHGANGAAHAAPQRPNLLSAQEIVKEYRVGGGVVTALRNVSLTVDEGEFIAIRGRSGAGKTTLLNIISGLDDAT